MDVRLVANVVTLNDVVRRMVVIRRYFSAFGSFWVSSTLSATEM